MLNFKKYWLVCILLAACGEESTAVSDSMPDLSAHDDARIMDMGPEQRDVRVVTPLDARVVSLPDGQPRPDLSPPEMDAEIDAMVECPTLNVEMQPWFNPFESPDIVANRSAHHSAQEPVINPGEAFTIQGHFVYGATSHSLGTERVEAWMQTGPCDEWVLLWSGETDRDGQIEFTIEDRELAEGRYPFELVVPGDLTRAYGAVWVVPQNQPSVVFDIDGTLTTSDRELFEEILLGSVPEMYEGANAVVQRYVERGYFVIYITGRPYFLNAISRTWLEDFGFPQGPLRTTDSLAESLPTEGGVQTFKRSYLRSLIDGPRLSFVAAYGNADTDVCGYAEAGIQTDRTWIIGPNAGTACDGFDPTNDVGTYPEHLLLLADLPVVP